LISSPNCDLDNDWVFHFMAGFLGNKDASENEIKFAMRFCQLEGRIAGREKAGILWLLVIFSVLGMPLCRGALAENEQPRFAALVFSKTTGFRHDSIPQGIAAIKTLGAERGFAVDSTEDAARFTDAELARYKVVVFLSTTGEILDEIQKAAFERYIRSGGGFVGIHSASDTEYQWAWYGRLVGAYFASHPQIQPATIRIEDFGHASTEGLPPAWERIDEWYNFRTNPRATVHVLATLDETTYTGGKMRADHPIAWCHMIDGGRSWYTAMGHTAESYAEPLFRRHLLGGIESAAGVAADCAR
jgi:type 1 glutamine amidotransferase